MDVRDLILKQRQAVMGNINRQFGVSAPVPIEKADDDTLEKGKWQIGMTREWQGKTYKCTGFSPATNRPTWSLVKDGGKGDGTTADKSDKSSDAGDKYMRKNDVPHIMWAIANSSKMNGAVESFASSYIGDSSLDFGKMSKKKIQEIVEKLPAEELDEMWDRYMEGKASKDKSVEDFMENVKKFNSEYTDPSKVSVVKTPKGNWDVSYDGHRLGILNRNQLDEKTAKEQGWLKDEGDDSTKSTPAVKKLSDLKTGDTVALIMERYNPQLGDYVTIKKVQIESATSKSFVVDYKKFDKISGERKDPSSTNYGSAKYYILLPQEVKNHIKDGKWKGDRISGGNPFEDKAVEEKKNDTNSTPAAKKPDFTPKIPASILRLTSRSSDSDIHDAWILLGREIMGDSTLNNVAAYDAAVKNFGGRVAFHNMSKTAQIDAMKKYYVDKAKQEEKNWQAEQNKKYWSSAEGQKRKGEIEKEMSDLTSGFAKVKTDVENKIRSITNVPDLKVDINPRNMIVSVLADNRYDVASLRVEENWNGDGYDNKFIMSSNNTDANNSSEVSKLQKILTSVSSMIANSDKIKKEAIASFGEIKKIQKRAQELQDELDADK